MSMIKSPISRRILLQTAALGAGVLAMPTILRAAPTKIFLGHGAAPGNPRSVAADKFAEIVKEKSGGAIEITVAGAAQLGDDAAMLTSLRTGVLGMSVNSQGAASAVVPEVAALGLPFLFPSAAAAIKACSGEITATLSARYEEAGIVLLGFWDNGIRNITNSKRPINVPADLSGLKLRTPPDPMTVDIFQSLGAATVQIPFAEVYVALQQGVVDGQENPLTNIHSAKLFEVNKYISLSAHKWESNPVLVSKMIWSQLDQKGQDVIREASMEAGAMQVQMNADKNDALLAEFKANPAVAVNECDRAAFQKATASVYDKWLAKDFGAFVQSVIKTAGA